MGPTTNHFWVKAIHHQAHQMYAESWNGWQVKAEGQLSQPHSVDVSSASWQFSQFYVPSCKIRGYDLFPSTQSAYSCPCTMRSYGASALSGLNVIGNQQWPSWHQGQLVMCHIAMLIAPCSVPLSGGQPQLALVAIRALTWLWRMSPLSGLVAWLDDHQLVHFLTRVNNSLINMITPLHNSYSFSHVTYNVKLDVLFCLQKVHQYAFLHNSCSVYCSVHSHPI